MSSPEHACASNMQDTKSYFHRLRCLELQGTTAHPTRRYLWSTAQGLNTWKPTKTRYKCPCTYMSAQKKTLRAHTCTHIDTQHSHVCRPCRSPPSPWGQWATLFEGDDSRQRGSRWISMDGACSHSKIHTHTNRHPHTHTTLSPCINEPCPPVCELIASWMTGLTSRAAFWASTSTYVAANRCGKGRLGMAGVHERQHKSQKDKIIRVLQRRARPGAKPMCKTWRGAPTVYKHCTGLLLAP